jgi:hypothetical protein
LRAGIIAQIAAPPICIIKQARPTEPERHIGDRRLQGA